LIFVEFGYLLARESHIVWELSVLGISNKDMPISYIAYDMGSAKIGGCTEGQKTSMHFPRFLAVVISAHFQLHGTQNVSRGNYADHPSHEWIAM
jgi:hypothetical protein